MLVIFSKVNFIANKPLKLVFRSFSDAYEQNYKS